MNSSNLKTQEATIDLGNDINAKITRHNNIDQTLITITEDKTDLILRDYLEKIEEKKSWTTPVAMFLSLILIPITTEKYRDAFSIPSLAWKTIIYLAIIATFIWCLHSFYKRFKNRTIEIKNIIQAMKKSDQSGQN